ncbi:hypothetical protein B0H11DRAFT_2080156 [Mycena galericulata]|nr:hypothetical protein B0H11DRAFT_2080156 [Mycena galericulata]
MVKICIENRDEGIWTEYEVDPVDSIRQLKAEIEEIEGFPIGRQCLRYQANDSPLQDGQALESYSIQENSILQVSRNQIRLSIDGWPAFNYEVDLDAPVCDFWKALVSTDGALVTNVALKGDFKWLNFKQQHIGLDDNRTFSSLGIQDNDSVIISSDGLLLGGEGGQGGYGRVLTEMEAAGGPGAGKTRVGLRGHETLYDWNGEMKHRHVKGLRLQRGILVYVTEEDAK